MSQSPKFVDAVEYLERMTASTGPLPDLGARELDDTELLRCVEEAERRGLAIGRQDAEDAYRGLLAGDVAMAERCLGRALFPQGADHIAGPRLLGDLKKEKAA